MAETVTVAEAVDRGRVPWPWPCAVTETVAETVWDRACYADPNQALFPHHPTPTKGLDAPLRATKISPLRGFDCSIVLCCIFGCFGHNIVNIAP